mmetsp:Transcript_18460/g.54730  ORF Transcript_18460/g.54730 Transcript_18460/m.54730 type:complete len:213 (+) Transcript_18460:194-832(+)
MRSKSHGIASVQRATAAAAGADGLRCRFSLMVRCEEPGCHRINVIAAGEDISLLQSRQFFCYMNKQADAAQCCHVRKPGEMWVPRRRAVQRRRGPTAGPRVAGKRVSSCDRDDWSQSPDSSSVSSRSTTSSPRAADDDDFGIPAVPYDIGSNIMVLHGKTVYPGKIIDRKVDAMVYLVKYDGLAASRNEWRKHQEVISMDEVISNRRACRDF